MSEEEPKYTIRPGQPPLGRRTVEKTVYFKFALLESQHRYISERAAELGVSAAEYLRGLIDRDKLARPPRKP